MLVVDCSRLLRLTEGALAGPAPGLLEDQSEAREGLSFRSFGVPVMPLFWCWSVLFVRQIG